MGATTGTDIATYGDVKMTKEDSEKLIAAQNVAKAEEMIKERILSYPGVTPEMVGTPVVFALIHEIARVNSVARQLIDDVHGEV